MSGTGFADLVPTLPSGRRAPRQPTAAVELITAALAAGWKTLLQWAEDSYGEPFLTVDLGIPEPYQHYRLCWHSRGSLARAEPGTEFDRVVSSARLRLFSPQVTTIAPGGPTETIASLVVVRQAIADHLERTHRPGIGDAVAPGSLR